MDFFEKYISHLSHQYPKLARANEIRTRLSRQLVSDQIVDLPDHIRSQAKAIVCAFFELRQNPIWKSKIETRHSEFTDPHHFSVLMSYDFHIDLKGQLRLIEINTNAAASLFVDALYAAQELENGFTKNYSEAVFNTFLNEYQLTSGSNERPTNMAIVDEHPDQQKGYLEFLMFKELFESRGIPTNILDVADLKFENGNLTCQDKLFSFDLIYNRHTDFYLKNPVSIALRQAILSGSICVTPHPHEYLLLADKTRLLEISKENQLNDINLQPSYLECLNKTLIRSIDLPPGPIDESLWSERKKWFFKPKQSFGSKAAYRGFSISRQVFQNLFDGEYLAQEYVPASKIKFSSASGSDSKEFKMDLRFYVYKNEVQLACARLYQGQVTNTSTPGGGFAAIRWT